MNTPPLFRLPLLMTALLAGLPAQAQTQAQVAGMSPADRDAAKARIEANHKYQRNDCGMQSTNVKDICVEEAGARHKVALAELQYGYTGKAADQVRLQVAKAEAAYAVARERCDDQTGTAKDQCVKEAQTAETQALAEARRGPPKGEAKRDAGPARRDSEYKLAVSKCQALAPDLQPACLSTAQRSQGRR